VVGAYGSMMRGSPLRLPLIASLVLFHHHARHRVRHIPVTNIIRTVGVYASLRRLVKLQLVTLTLLGNFGLHRHRAREKSVRRISESSLFLGWPLFQSTQAPLRVQAVIQLAVHHQAHTRPRSHQCLHHHPLPRTYGSASLHKEVRALPPVTVTF